MATRTALNYRALLQSLLPKGRAWNRDKGSVLTEFLYGQAEEFARVDGRSLDLLSERDTRISSELLVDHEKDLGLPDSCSEADETIQERRLSAHARLIALGQQSPAYFIELALAAGWTITITEFSPFWCGVGASGDECGDQTNIFHWKVTITVNTGVIYFICGSSQSGDPLQFIPGTESLMCILNKYKPGHTVLTFDVDGIEFGIGYNSAFDSVPSGAESYLVGAFGRGFGSGFDVYWGGAFAAIEFGPGYKRPQGGVEFIEPEGDAFSVEYDSAFDSILSPSGIYFTGAFHQGFRIGFNVNWGGEFSRGAFGNGYHQPVED